MDTQPDVFGPARFGPAVRSACTHCTRCMATIYHHTHRVVTAAPDSLPVPG